jgi:hypothetical protein
MLEFMRQIGPVNTKYLKTLHMWVACVIPGSWLELLCMLAQKATGMRNMVITWATEFEFPWALERGAEERGLGDDLDFVRALAKIRGLKTLEISGYYVKTWPAYLEAELGAQVRAKCGHEVDLSDGELESDELTVEELKCELNSEELRNFTRYQQGTEYLIP